MSATVTQRHWKKSAALYSALVLRPDLDRKELKKLAQKILALADEEAGLPKITDMEVTTLLWSNSQCVNAQSGSCPLLIFGKQLADRLNDFFHSEQ